MPQVNSLEAQFVEFMPDQLDEGSLYVSMEYATVVHLCACGCRNKVVTPLSPTDWKLGYNGAGVTLSPSVGNWSFPCRSHYIIDHGRIRWAGPMSDQEVKHVRRSDRAAKARQFGEDIPELHQTTLPAPQVSQPSAPPARLSLWTKLKRALLG